jgi:hypothetical protein
MTLKNPAAKQRKNGAHSASCEPGLRQAEQAPKGRKRFNQGEMNYSKGKARVGWNA